MLDLALDMPRFLHEIKRVLRMKQAKASRQFRVVGQGMDMGHQLKLMGRLGQELVIGVRS